MAKLHHSGGLIDVIIELGFDEVKYFQGAVSGTASGFDISPPARRVTVMNTSDDDNVFVRINGGDATTSVGFTPGDDIKVGPGCTFSMDYDVLTELSFITSGSAVNIEGLIGWKGTEGC
jgi:hypothetical protein